MKRLKDGAAAAAAKSAASDATATKASDLKSKMEQDAKNARYNASREEHYRP